MKALISNTIPSLPETIGSFSALILAAGNSSRMGVDKALLPYDKDYSFVHFLVDQYCDAGAKQVVIVVNERFNRNTHFPSIVELIVNTQVELGRSHSMELGIAKVPDRNACFIQNVDNPYLGPILIGTMLSQLMPGSYIIPVFENRGGHPILLSSQMVISLKAMGRISDFKSYLERYKRVDCPWEDKGILFNINTPAEYRSFVSERH